MLIEDDKYKATKIGGVFTILSLLTNFTFFIPMISIFPVLVIESYAGTNSIVIMSIILVVFLFVSFYNIHLMKKKQGQVTKKRIITLMILSFFIFHSLYFPIYFNSHYKNSTDGQLIFTVMESIPISSYAFLVFGLLIDLVKNNTRTVYSEHDYEDNAL